MPEHTFSLILDGDVEARLDELFEHGCDDATFGSVDGVPYADFDREAESLGEAIRSAISDVESIDDVRVRRIEPDDLVTAAEIAQRLGRTRESVRLLIAGRRGPGGFPPPVSHLRTRNRLWRWSDVLAWSGAEEVDRVDVDLVAAINAALELRNRRTHLPKRERGVLATVR